MHRSMRCGEGVEEKEGFVVFCIDEIDRLLSEYVSQVAIEFDRLPILFNRSDVAWLIIVFGIVEITSRTGSQTVKIIETSSSRIKLILIPQVPLADQPSPVSQFFETVRHGDLL